MALKVWWSEQIRGQLLSLDNAAKRYPPGPYRDGYREALYNVAIAFGIGPEAEREEVEYRQTWAPLHTGRRGDGGYNHSLA